MSKEALVEGILMLPRLSTDMIHRLQNKAPTLSEELLTIDYYDKIDVLSDDDECLLGEDDENINYNTGEPEELIPRHASSNCNKNILCDNTDLIKKDLGTVDPKTGIFQLFKCILIIICYFHLLYRNNKGRSLAYLFLRETGQIQSLD